jgi:hypothetical protein
MERVRIVLQNPKYRLEVEVERDAPTALASPILGLIDGRIEETMNAVANIQLIEKRTNRVLLEDSGHNTGLEVAGDIERILKP